MKFQLFVCSGRQWDAGYITSVLAIATASGDAVM